MSDPSFVSPGAGPARESDPAETLRGLWRQGQRPDVEAFLAKAGRLTPAQLADVLRVDQRQRWAFGERIPVEDYFRRHPAVQDDAECALDLIFSEFLVRERFGDKPDVDEYVARFPRHGPALRAQVEIQRALLADPTQTEVPSSGGATDPGKTDRLATAASRSRAALPEEFGRYRIIRVLGKGGMGTVYLAQDTRLGRTVALKVTRFDEAPDSPAAQRFFREARIAATFTHPNLCPIYDVGQIGDVYYLTMPFLQGELLSVRLKRSGALPQPLAARLACRIAQALAEAHKQGVIHRDLKPANVMITPTGEPVVMDFGLAHRETVGDPRMTPPGAVLGTPAYLAPEQIGGDPEDMGPACDVYGLGAMLYEMLTGRMPFEGSSFQVLRQALADEPRRPSEYRPDLDSRLEIVCRIALAKDPAQRFASMAEFAKALEVFLQETDTLPPTVLPGQLAPSPAPGESQPKTMPSRGQTRRWALWIAVGGLGAIAVGGVIWFLLPSADRPAGVLPLGSRWTGTFYWARTTTHYPIEVTITERDGEQFQGEQQTEGQFAWRIKGQVSQGKIWWEFTQWLRGGGDAKGLVGNGQVEGTVDGETMEAVFRDPRDKSVAHMKLRLRK